MKGPLLIAAAVAVAAAIAWALWPRTTDSGDRGSSESAEAGAPSTAQRGGGASGAGGSGFAASALRDAVVASGAPGSTLPLDKPATAADGFVEARVLAQGKPFQGA